LPYPLISAAERHGFISRIDRWVLKTILAWLDDHPDHRSKINYCAVNLSGASLNDERFLRDILAIVRDHPLAMQRICFEITETVALLDLTTTQRFIAHVREFGAKVALDDFGAGYTSFNSLKALKADLVKIDGSFIQTLDTDRSNFAITRTIFDLVHELNMSCVAEWVETPRVAGILTDMGVDYGQGNALCKPLSLDEILQYKSGGDTVTDLAVLAELQAGRGSRFLVRHGEFGRASQRVDQH
jgi:EAL domain-containing protein (putative c-di-GMP-specific phosphodiesterase class I)